MEPQFEQKQQNPYLQFLLILDFEATCQEKGKMEPCSQIIQFPVIAISTKTYQQVGRFHRYLFPRFNPKLTKFCIQLTGINQNQVDEGIVLQDALKQFDQWIKQMHNKPNCLKSGKDKNFAFVTCGDWDLKICLSIQCKVKKINYPQYMKEFVNIKKYFSKILKLQQLKRQRGMMGMLSKLQMEHKGRHHSGIDDSANIARICIKLIQEYDAKFQKTQIVMIK